MTALDPVHAVNRAYSFLCSLVKTHWLLSQKTGSTNISVKELITSNFREHEDIRVNEALISS